MTFYCMHIARGLCALIMVALCNRADHYILLLIILHLFTHTLILHHRLLLYY